MDAARARGVRLGRPPAMTPEQIRHAHDLLTRPDNTVSSIARLLGVSRATICNTSRRSLTAACRPITGRCPMWRSTTNCCRHIGQPADHSSGRHCIAERVKVEGDFFRGHVPGGAVYVGRAAPACPARRLRTPTRPGSTAPRRPSGSTVSISPRTPNSPRPRARTWPGTTSRRGR